MALRVTLCVWGAAMLIALVFIGNAILTINATTAD
jgi:hypothetical protein